MTDMRTPDDWMDHHDYYNWYRDTFDTRYVFIGKSHLKSCYTPQGCDFGFMMHDISGLHLVYLDQEIGISNWSFVGGPQLSLTERIKGWNNLRERILAWSTTPSTELRQIALLTAMLNRP